MRVALTGATGNAGTSVIRAFETDDRVTSIVGIARRRPGVELPKVEWAAADVSCDDLVPILRGADVVIHLAWLIQPSRRLDVLRATNVDGSRRVFAATAEAGVRSLVYASSVGAYSPGPKDRLVDESWPTGGIASSFYSRHKAEVERILDDFERDNAHTRVVRLRPALIFKRESSTGQRRLFAGPLLPAGLVRPGVLPFVPDTRRLVFQAVHSYDIGEAYRLAATSDVRGAFNIAADPVLDPPTIATALRSRLLPVPGPVLRLGAAVTWRLRLQPSPEGWVDMGLNAPLMDSSRARAELGWEPRHTATEALVDLVEGMSDGEGFPTPPLDPGAGGTLRRQEFATGVGQRT